MTVFAPAFRTAVMSAAALRRVHFGLWRRLGVGATHFLCDFRPGRSRWIAMYSAPASLLPRETVSGLCAVRLFALVFTAPSSGGVLSCVPPPPPPPPPPGSIGGAT